jgi:hypothetical protein
MLVDEATQIEIEQEPSKDRGVTIGHVTGENKEEGGEVECSVSDLHGHIEFSNPE